LIGGMLLTAVLLVVAFISDVTRQKIPNILSAAGLAGGILLHAFISGSEGFVYSFSGALLGFVPLFFLYLVRAVGAGDVKLFAAVGALAGTEFVLHSIMYSLIYAALIGCFILFWRSEWKERGLSAARVAFQFIVWKEAMPLLSYGKTVQHLRFPFMWAVLPAAATAFWQMT
jgi:prepilin peptidase CpaA